MLSMWSAGFATRRRDMWPNALAPTAATFPFRWSSRAIRHSSAHSVIFSFILTGQMPVGSPGKDNNACQPDNFDSGEDT